MKMKNIVSVCVLGLASLLLTACGGGASSSSSSPVPQTGSGTTNTANNAPVISGSATLALQTGQSYSFTPVATDADGDALSFSVSNLPTWASFNSSTGAITGTPTVAGTYSNIVVTVTDSKANASLAAFTITVTAPVANTKNLSISWTAPTQYEDGTSLTSSNIGGFRVYKGTSAGNLQLVADINSASTSSYTISGLTAGTYYIAVTTYDANGIESTYSSVMSANI